MSAEKVYLNLLLGAAILAAFFGGLVLMKNSNFFVMSLGWLMVLSSPVALIKYLRTIFKTSQEEPASIENKVEIT